MSQRSERGAAAVEFALVLPILVLLVFGIVEFSRAYNAQITLTSASREGARVMAIKNDPVAAKQATINASPSLNPALTDEQITASACTNTTPTTTVTAKYDFEFVTGWFGDGFTLTGKGVMRCNG